MYLYIFIVSTDTLAHGHSAPQGKGGEENRKSKIREREEEQCTYDCLIRMSQPTENLPTFLLEFYIESMNQMGRIDISTILSFLMKNMLSGSLNSVL